MKTLEPPTLCSPRRTVKRREIEFERYDEANVSGTSLLGRFALPCGYDKFIAGQMSHTNWSRLVSLTMSNQLDESAFHELLKTIFPDLVANLQAASRSSSGVAGDRMWRYGHVLGFLITHHGHSLECAAKCVEIREYLGQQKSPVSNNNHGILSGLLGNVPMSPLFDLYDLCPRFLSKALVHKNVIVAII